MWLVKFLHAHCLSISSSVLSQVCLCKLGGSVTSILPSKGENACLSVDVSDGAVTISSSKKVRCISRHVSCQCFAHFIIVFACPLSLDLFQRALPGCLCKLGGSVTSILPSKGENACLSVDVSDGAVTISSSKKVRCISRHVSCQYFAHFIIVFA